LELAIQQALKLNATQIVIHCTLGKRVDHTLANLLTLKQIPKNVKGQIITQNQTISLVQDEQTLQKKDGERVSIIPLEPLKGLNYEGLKWEVKDLNTNAGWFGISNIIVDKKATIRLQSGSLLLIQIKDKMK